MGTKGIARYTYKVLQDTRSKGYSPIFGDIIYEDDNPISLEPAIVAIDPKATSDIRIVDEGFFGPSASLQQ